MCSGVIIYAVDAANVASSMGRNDLEWAASYVYDRWKPTLFLSAARDTAPPDAGELTSHRSLEATAGAIVPWNRVRWSHALFAALHVEDRTGGCARTGDCTGPPSLSVKTVCASPGRSGTAREYGYSISAEHGGSVAVTGERILPALGSDGEATRLTGDVRFFAPVGPQHATLAMRAAGGGIEGDTRVRRQTERRRLRTSVGLL